MYTAQPKKLLILQILDILRKHSDENHRLSQKEIAGLLEKEYGVTAERKAVKRNLMDLIEYGYPIEYDEIKRSTANRATGEMDDTSKLSGFYLAHDLPPASTFAEPGADQKAGRIGKPVFFRPGQARSHPAGERSPQPAGVPEHRDFGRSHQPEPAGGVFLQRIRPGQKAASQAG